MKTLTATLAALVLTGLFASAALACGDYENVLRESGDQGPVAVPESDAIIIQADVYAREGGGGGATSSVPPSPPVYPPSSGCSGILCLPYFWVGLL